MWSFGSGPGGDGVGGELGGGGEGYLSKPEALAPLVRKSNVKQMKFIPDRVHPSAMKGLDQASTSPSDSLLCLTGILHALFSSDTVPNSDLRLEYG